MRLRRALDELHVAGDAGSRRAYGGPDGRRTPAPAGPAGGDAPSAPQAEVPRAFTRRSAEAVAA